MSYKVVTKYKKTNKNNMLYGIYYWVGMAFYYLVIESI